MRTSSIDFSTEWNIDGCADPEFAIGIAAVEHGAGMEPVTDATLGGVAETGFNGIVVFPDRPGIINGVIGVQDNVAAGNALEVPVTDVQLTAFDLLKEADDGDVLVVGSGAIPTEQRVSIHTEPRGTEVLSQKEFRFNGRGTTAGGERDAFIERTGNDGAGAKSERRKPGRVGGGFIENLIPDPEGGVHDAGGGFNRAVVEEAPANGGGADSQIRSPILDDAVLDRNIALGDIYAVTFAVRVSGDVMGRVAGPDTKGFRFFVHGAHDKLARARDVRPHGKGPMGNVLRSHQGWRQPHAQQHKEAADEVTKSVWQPDFGSLHPGVRFCLRHHKPIPSLSHRHTPKVPSLG